MQIITYECILERELDANVSYHLNGFWMEWDAGNMGFGVGTCSNQKLTLIRMVRCV